MKNLRAVRRKCLLWLFSVKAWSRLTCWSFLSYGDELWVSFRVGCPHCLLSLVNALTFYIQEYTVAWISLLSFPFPAQTGTPKGPFVGSGYVWERPCWVLWQKRWSQRQTCRTFPGAERDQECRGLGPPPWSPRRNTYTLSWESVEAESCLIRQKFT